MSNPWYTWNPKGLASTIPMRGFDREKAAYRRKLYDYFTDLNNRFKLNNGHLEFNDIDGTVRLVNDIGTFYGKGRVLLKDGRKGNYDPQTGHIISIDGLSIKQPISQTTALVSPEPTLVNSDINKPVHSMSVNSAVPTNWYNKYKNNKGLFNISRTDLEKWANQFGDETTKNYVKNWTGKSDRELWRDSNSGMSQTFKNFTNWVKNNGGLESKVGNMDLSMSNGNFTYDKNNWTFNKGTIGLVNLTSGTDNPYKPYNPTLSNDSILNSTLNTKVEAPQVSPNMNRSQTRDYMRSKGINPYSYSGAERRALRLYMNGDTAGSGYDINLLKNSDLGNKLNLKFQQGGKMNELQLQQAFLQYLMLKTGAQNEQQLEQVIQQMGLEGVKQAYAQFIQEMQQQQVQAAKFGAKLNYIKRLNGQCPEGELLHYYKVGGKLCKKCMKAEQDRKENAPNPIDAFKCGRKIRKHQLGGISTSL